MYSNSWEGALDVHIQGEWRPVCDDKWDIKDAKVACRQLGYADALKSGGKAKGPFTNDDFWLDDLNCIGNETSLCNCSSSGIGNENCGAIEVAYVACACKLSLV